MKVTFGQFGWRFCVLMLFPVVAAQAQVVHKPFALNDGNLTNRKDIKNLIASFPLQVPAKLAGSVTDMMTQDAHLYVTTEVAKVLWEAAHPASTLTHLDDPSLDHCQRHAGLSAQRLPSIAAGSVCAALAGQVTAALARAPKVCRYAHSPEQFVQERAPGTVGESDTQTLEGMLSVAGEPLQRNHSFPANLLTQELIADMRSVITKIRYGSLRQDMEQQQQRYSSILGALAQKSACITTPASRQPQVMDDVRALSDELKRAQEKVEKIEADGRAQAAVDKQRIIQSGKKRDDLPFPSLTDREREQISMYVGGIYWRMRGGGLVGNPRGTKAARREFNQVPMQIISVLNGGERVRGIGDAIYDRISKGWADWMDMGRSQGDDRYHDLTFMTDRGRYQTEAAADFMRKKGYDSSAVQMAGMMMGPIYFWSWDSITLRIGDGSQEPFRPLADGQTAWGEMGIGASISLAISRTLLAGY